MGASPMTRSVHRTKPRFPAKPEHRDSSVKIMACVYILQSEITKKYYVGSTQDLSRRIKEHFSGKVYTTKRMLPVRLVFTQKYSSIIIAKNIEKKLKAFKSKVIIQKIIEDGVIKITG